MTHNAQRPPQSIGGRPPRQCGGRIAHFFFCFCLIFEQTSFAQVAQTLDISGYFNQARNAVIPQDKFRPLHLRYISYDSQSNDFQLLLDKGDTKFDNHLANELTSSPANELNNATKELLKYFFIGLSLPNDKFWVNLRPDSPDNIIDDDVAMTDIGRIFLEADVQLKKDTANFTSPQDPEGKVYWDKLYKKAEELFGTENITIPTLTRPWIVPNEIIIREAPDNAYIYKATLKVMLEEDYLRGMKDEGRGTIINYSFKDPRLKELNEYSTQLIRELVIPKLTYQVNTSKRYASLRQVYYSLILAQWFKARFRSQMTENREQRTEKANDYFKLIDSGALTNLVSKELYDKQDYFQQYQKSFQDGEYNLTEPIYTPMGQSIRKYMSGGMMFGTEQVSSAISKIPAKTISPPRTKFLIESFATDRASSSIIEQSYKIFAEALNKYGVATIIGKAAGIGTSGEDVVRFMRTENNDVAGLSYLEELFKDYAQWAGKENLAIFIDKAVSQFTSPANNWEYRVNRIIMDRFNPVTGHSGQSLSYLLSVDLSMLSSPKALGRQLGFFISKRVGDEIVYQLEQIKRGGLRVDTSLSSRTPAPIVYGVIINPTLSLEKGDDGTTWNVIIKQTGEIYKSYRLPGLSLEDVEELAKEGIRNGFMNTSYDALYNGRDGNAVLPVVTERYGEDLRLLHGYGLLSEMMEERVMHSVLFVSQFDTIKKKDIGLLTGKSGALAWSVQEVSFEDIDYILVPEFLRDQAEKVFAEYSKKLIFVKKSSEKVEVTNLDYFGGYGYEGWTAKMFVPDYQSALKEITEKNPGLTLWVHGKRLPTEDDMVRRVGLNRTNSINSEKSYNNVPSSAVEEISEKEKVASSSLMSFFGRNPEPKELSLVTLANGSKDNLDAKNIWGALKSRNIAEVVSQMEMASAHNQPKAKPDSNVIDSAVKDTAEYLENKIGSKDKIRKMTLEKFIEEIGVFKVKIGITMFMLDRASAELIKRVRELAGGAGKVWDEIEKATRYMAPESIPSIVWMFHPSVQKEGIYYSPAAYHAFCQELGISPTKSVFLHELLEQKFVERGAIDSDFNFFFQHAHPRILEEELKFASEIGELETRIKAWRDQIEKIKDRIKLDPKKEIGEEYIRDIEKVLNLWGVPLQDESTGAPAPASSAVEDSADVKLEWGNTITMSDIKKVIEDINSDRLLSSDLKVSELQRFLFRIIHDSLEIKDNDHSTKPQTKLLWDIIYPSTDAARKDHRQEYFSRYRNSPFLLTQFIAELKKEFIEAGIDITPFRTIFRGCSFYSEDTGGEEKTVKEREQHLLRMRQGLLSELRADGTIEVTNPITHATFKLKVCEDKDKENFKYLYDPGENVLYAQNLKTKRDLWIGFTGDMPEGYEGTKIFIDWHDGEEFVMAEYNYKPATLTNVMTEETFTMPNETSAINLSNVRDNRGIGKLLSVSSAVERKQIINLPIDGSSASSAVGNAGFEKHDFDKYAASPEKLRELSLEDFVKWIIKKNIGAGRLNDGIKEYIAKYLKQKDNKESDEINLDVLNNVIVQINTELPEAEIRKERKRLVALVGLRDYVSFLKHIKETYFLEAVAIKKMSPKELLGKILKSKGSEFNEYVVELVHLYIENEQGLFETSGRIDSQKLSRILSELGSMRKIDNSQTIKDLEGYLLLVRDIREGLNIEFLSYVAPSRFGDVRKILGSFPKDLLGKIKIPIKIDFAELDVNAGGWVGQKTVHTIFINGVRNENNFIDLAKTFWHEIMHKISLSSDKNSNPIVSFDAWIEITRKAGFYGAFHNGKLKTLDELKRELKGNYTEIRDFNYGDWVYREDGGRLVCYVGEDSYEELKNDSKYQDANVALKRYTQYWKTTPKEAVAVAGAEYLFNSARACKPSLGRFAEVAKHLGNVLFFGKQYNYLLEPEKGNVSKEEVFEKFKEDAKVTLELVGGSDENNTFWKKEELKGVRPNTKLKGELWDPMTSAYVGKPIRFASNSLNVWPCLSIIPEKIEVINESTVIIYSDEGGVYKISLDSTSSSSVSDDKGGIDFAALPIQTQQIQSLQSLVSRPLSITPKSDLDKEWSQIQAVFNAGIRPSVQRIGEYTAAAVASPLSEERIDQVRAMLADILRREEEDEKLPATEPSLKGLLIALESDKV